MRLRLCFPHPTPLAQLPRVVPLYRWPRQEAAGDSGAGPRFGPSDRVGASARWVEMQRGAWAAGDPEAAPGRTESLDSRGGEAVLAEYSSSDPTLTSAATRHGRRCAQAAPAGLWSLRAPRCARSLRPLSRRDVAEVVSACARPEGGACPAPPPWQRVCVYLPRPPSCQGRSPPCTFLPPTHPWGAEDPLASGLARAPRLRRPGAKGGPPGGRRGRARLGSRKPAPEQSVRRGLQHLCSRSAILPLALTEALQQTSEQNKAGPLAPVLQLRKPKPIWAPGRS